MSEAYLNIGWVLGQLGRQEDAAASYATGLQLGSWPAQTAAVAQNNRGALLRGMGRDEEARASFRAALAARPDFEQAADNLAAMADADGDGSGSGGFVALINAANERLVSDRLAEAAELYRQALPLRDTRRDGAAYVGLGAALHGAGRLAEAKHVLELGAELNPASPGMNGP